MSSIEAVKFRSLYECLAAQFHIECWWPGESNFEIMVGAVLTQNTTWTSVEQAIANLKAADMLTPAAIVSCPAAILEGLIRPSGSYTRKAATLKHLAAWLEEHGERAGSIDSAALRASLMGIHGVGPETADDILLYVFDRPVFIFDAYARRMLDATGMSVGTDYEKTRLLHEDAVAHTGLSVSEFAHFHGLIVTAGKHARTVGWTTLLSSKAG